VNYNKDLLKSISQFNIRFIFVLAMFYCVFFMANSESRKKEQ
jgi:hypothetical protein